MPSGNLAEFAVRLPLASRLEDIQQLVSARAGDADATAISGITGTVSAAASHSLARPGTRRAVCRKDAGRFWYMSPFRRAMAGSDPGGPGPTLADWPGASAGYMPGIRVGPWTGERQVKCMAALSNWSGSRASFRAAL